MITDNTIKRLSRYSEKCIADNFDPDFAEAVYEAIGDLMANEQWINKIERDLKDCKNELCLKCGEYKMRHKGACDGCRWLDE